MWVLGVWRPLWEADLMETCCNSSAASEQWAIYRRGGVGAECLPGAGDHRPGPHPAHLQMPAMWAAQPDCDPLLGQCASSRPRGLCPRGRWRKTMLSGEKEPVQGFLWAFPRCQHHECAGGCSGALPGCSVEVLQNTRCPGNSGLMWVFI